MIEAMPGQARPASLCHAHTQISFTPLFLPMLLLLPDSSQLIVIYVCWRFLRLLMSIWLQGNYIHFVCIRKLVGSVSVSVKHKKWKNFLTQQQQERENEAAAAAYNLVLAVNDPQAKEAREKGPKTVLFVPS